MVFLCAEEENRIVGIWSVLPSPPPPAAPTTLCLLEPTPTPAPHPTGLVCVVVAFSLIHILTWHSVYHVIVTLLPQGHQLCLVGILVCFAHWSRRAPGMRICWRAVSRHISHASPCHVLPVWPAHQRSALSPWVLSSARFSMALPQNTLCTSLWHNHNL
jgi:hypothetical protein